jgi:uncharacterized secreted protein with C-terminal beta-propeller domain
MKAQIPVMLALVLGVIIFAGAAIIAINTQDISPEPSQLKKFASYQDMKDYVKASSELAGMPYYSGFFGATQTMRTVAPAVMPLGAVAEGAAKDYAGEDFFSATNIQVEGVDEADIVKSDGKHVYIVSQNKVFIIDAYPAENAAIISEIEPEGSISEIFVNGDRLVVFGQKSQYPYYEGGVMKEMIAPPPDRYYSPEMFAKVYDITDRSNPVIARDVTVNGTYYDSRMIGGYVYIVINSPIQGDHIIVPLPYVNGQPARPPGVFPEVYYFDNPAQSYRFTTIMSINTQNDNEEPNSEIYMMGYTDNMYVSQDHIYITYQKHIEPYVFIDRIIDDVIMPVVPGNVANQIDAIRSKDISEAEKMSEIGDVFTDYINGLSGDQKRAAMEQVTQNAENVMIEISKELEKTMIQKIAISSGQIQYKAQGSVSGQLLNQFSMDQHGDYFRVATTSGSFWGGTSANNVYVLDSGMSTVGKLEDLAPGERIYSVRFIGDRAYMVTFKKIDPLFVIDLSQPANPSILGKLKIPGYSDYLHPYDENHIIGIGKHTVEAEEGLKEQRNLDFAWYQGLKIALFDVSDVNRTPTRCMTTRPSCSAGAGTFL